MATITITLRETGQSVTVTLKAAAPPPKIKDFVVDEEGYITKVSETNGHNMYRLHRKTNWDKGIKDKYITLNNGKVIEELAKGKNHNIQWTQDGEKKGVWVNITNKLDAYKLFKFVCDASLQAEWALDVYDKVNGTKKGIYVLGTVNYSDAAGTFPPPAEYSILDLKINYHSHPGTAPVDDKASEDLGGFGDTVTANWYYDYFKKAGKKIVPSFMIYRPHQSPSYSFQYTNKITKENIRIIKNISDLYERINEYRLK
ncbi:hypothetical protein [Capnocytophaga sputigena]|jgi:hypothetical protein|uniref:hypothetical protein n=1 Tax=Capnocytophaga sputigena TaxID=1019 RepID=UPI0028EAA5CC|nr:hypothetical protein [Capnocytophaga sputigena]